MMRVESRLPFWVFVGVLLFSLGWDLRAVLLDTRLSGSDTFTPQALSLIEHGKDGGLKGLWGWMAQLGYKGPLAPLLSLPLLVVLGHVPLSTRLVSVAAHGLLLWHCFRFASALDCADPDRDTPKENQINSKGYFVGSWGGVWAALLMATSPLVFGWARLAFHETLLAVVVLASLQLMANNGPWRPRQAATLGLVLGLGLLTKLAFLVFSVIPGTWLLVRRLRDRRSALLLLLVVVVAALVASPWALSNARTIYWNFHMSTAGDEPLWPKITGYLGVPEAYLLIGAALLSTVVLWIRATVDRWILALLGGSIVGSLALFVLVFDFWSRYAVPIFPVAAVLVGLGLSRLGDGCRRAGRAARVTAIVCSLALAGGLLHYYLLLNIAPVKGENPRDFFAGMTSPDTRRYPALPNTIGALLRHGPRILILMDRGSNPHRISGLFNIWWYRGLDFRLLELPAAQAMSRAGQPVSVLIIRGPSDHELSPDERNPPCPPLRGQQTPDEELSEGRRWLVEQTDRRCVKAVVDPDRMAYVAYRIPER